MFWVRNAEQTFWKSPFIITETLLVNCLLKSPKTPILCITFSNRFHAHFTVWISSSLQEGQNKRPAINGVFGEFRPFFLSGLPANKAIRNEKINSLLLVTRVCGTTSHGATSTKQLLLYSMFLTGPLGGYPRWIYFSCSWGVSRGCWECSSLRVFGTQTGKGSQKGGTRQSRSEHPRHRSVHTLSFVNLSSYCCPR